MKSAKFREAERVTPEIGSMENYNEQEEESYSSLGFRDDVLIEGEESDFGFELEDNTASEDQEEEWTPDEQFRLLYVYFKDMAVESLLTAKEEIEVSAQIKNCESKTKELTSHIQKLSKRKDSFSGKKKSRTISEKELAKRIESLMAFVKVYS
jgi:hypothetical protein